MKVYSATYEHLGFARIPTPDYFGMRVQIPLETELSVYSDRITAEMTQQSTVFIATKVVRGERAWVLEPKQDPYLLPGFIPLAGFLVAMAQEPLRGELEGSNGYLDYIKVALRDRIANQIARDVEISEIFDHIMGQKILIGQLFYGRKNEDKN